MHEHVAPIAPVLPAGVTEAIPDPTPRLNRPNGIWDNGEGFPPLPGGGEPIEDPADTGGWLGRDRGEGIFDDRFVHTTTSWVTDGTVTPTTQHFVGYLNPDPIPSGQPIPDAAFELFAPSPSAWVTSGPHASKLFVVIETFGTLGKLPAGGRFAYPGTRADGLIPTAGPLPARPNYSPDLVDLARELGYNVVSGYIVPRLNGRPMVFAMQRNLQLLAALEHLLAPGSSRRPPGMPTAIDVANPRVVIAGPSFGGIVAPIATLLFPNHFHGAWGGSGPASLRRGVLGEQEAWRLIQASCGFSSAGSSGNYGKAYDAPDTLSWRAWLHQEGTDYYSASVVRRFANGELPRPVYWMVGDEDPTTTATDWASLLHGSRAGWDHAFVLTLGPPDAHVFWSTADKRSHSGLHAFPLATTGAPLVKDAEAIVLDLFPQVDTSVTNNPTVAVPARIVAEPFLAPPTTATSEDGHDWVLARRPATFQAPAAGSPLVLDPSFGPATGIANRPPGKTWGQGTWLGYDESLIATDDALYAGNTDGIVMRYEVAPTEEIVLTHRTRSLGYGAWALAVGEIDPGSAGAELVVGTYRNIHVLRAADLTELRSFGGGTANLPWDHDRPRRIAIAEVFAATAGKEVVYTTGGGRLVVLDKDLNVLCDYLEPGIADFVVQEGTTFASQPPPHTQSSTVPITLLSHRGHLVTVTLGLAGEPPALLHAASPRIEGVPLDLELVTASGQTRLAALHFDASTGPTYRLCEFDPVTLQPIPAREFDLDLGSVPIGADMAVLHDLGGAAYYCISNPETFSVVRQSDLSLFRQYYTRSFAPAVGANSVAVGDFVDHDPMLEVPFEDEVVLSTDAGQLVWFSLNETPAGGPPAVAFELPRNYSTTALNPVTPHTNRALVATWGMVAHEGGSDPRLEVVDQTGSRWTVLPNGDLRFVGELRGYNATDPFIPVLRSGPIRGMVHHGSVLAPMPQSPPWFVDSFVANAAALSGSCVRTYPYIPTIPVPPGFVTSSGGIWRQVTGGTSDPLHDVIQYGEHFVFELGGDYLPDPAMPGRGELHWWTGQASGTYREVIGGVRVDGPTASRGWLSHYDDVGRNEENDFRNIINFVTIHDLQSLKAFRAPSGETMLAAATLGGSVLFVRPGDLTLTTADKQGKIVAESADFGLGGAALTVAEDLFGGNTAHVFIGTVVHHPDRGPYQTKTGPVDIGGSIHMLSYTDSGTPTVTSINERRLDNTGPQSPAGYGVCGLAVGDVDGVTGPELVAGTMNGDVYVYDLSAAGIGALKQRFRLEGALGCFNSIVIADLDSGSAAPGNEVYIASTQGIWKLIRGGTP